MSGMPFVLGWRMLRRELRSGELRLLFAALAIAVAAVTAVGFFTDRVRVALNQQAQQLIGGDLVLIGDQPWPDAWRLEAEQRGLRQAETLVFPSMVVADGRMQLAEIKAVSSNYPLRGQLLITPAVDSRLQSGEVWLDERLAGNLKLAPKDKLNLGLLRFPVGAILTHEPDRGINFLSFAPRLMMHLDDVGKSGLIQSGSRITYRFLFAGDPSVIAGFRAWLEPQLSRGQRLEDIQNARPEIRSALDRAQRFLGLATLLTVVLAAVAVALASRRYMQRHLDACAVMRCLGLTQNSLVTLHLTTFFWLAIISGCVGVLVGFTAHFALIAWLSKLLTMDLPLPTWHPLLPGFLVAGVLLAGFALPPLMQLSRVPTLRVLRRELGPPQPLLLVGYLLGILLLAGLIIWVAGDLRLGGLAVAGFVAALAGFWLIAQICIGLLIRIPTRIGFGWRQGLSNLARHRTASVVQIVALAIGLMAMLLLTLTRAELLDAWQNAMPADAPNRFVVNIQTEQRGAIQTVFENAGIAAEISPMIRGRLKSISGKSVSAADFPDDERAQRLVEREFNLSWRVEMPAGNQLVSGRWFAPEDKGTGQASVEEGLARTLGIRLGDELVFTIAGVEKSVRITSLRKLAWDSMRVNFFVLMPPGVIEDSPASYITSFYLPPDRSTFPVKLLAEFPNLTLIDIGEIMRQLQAIVSQVAAAVQFVFLFTLLAGGVVLYAALLSAFDERRHELALMRALGASRSQLKNAMLAELAIVGSIAGLIAALGASLLGQFIAHQVFQLEIGFDLRILFVAILSGGCLAVSAGWFVLRKLLSTPPLLVLKAGV
jgi:putative ABC transport system permease protein